MFERPLQSTTRGKKTNNEDIINSDRYVAMWFNGCFCVRSYSWYDYDNTVDRENFVVKIISRLRPTAKIQHVDKNIYSVMFNE